jgi:hypothetical protein
VREGVFRRSDDEEENASFVNQVHRLRQFETLCRKPYVVALTVGPNWLLKLWSVKRQTFLQPMKRFTDKIWPERQTIDSKAWNIQSSRGR